MDAKSRRHPTGNVPPTPWPVGLFLFLFASVAPAEVAVELVPDRPGPYVVGESLTVDVWLHSEVSSDKSLEFVRFDFSNSDPMLSLSPTFTFDFSSIYPAPIAYDIRFTDLPLPWTGNPAMCICPELFLWLPAGGSLHIGSVGLTLPTEPGVYALDLLNAETADPMQGAMINVGPYWRASSGEITGGTHDFVVNSSGIPTVSTWGLAILGLLLLVGRKVFFTDTLHLRHARKL